MNWIIPVSIWCAGIGLILGYLAAKFMWGFNKTYRAWFQAFIHDKREEAPSAKEVAEHICKIGHSSDYEVVSMLIIAMVIGWPIVAIIVALNLFIRYTRLNKLFWILYGKTCEVVDSRLLRNLTIKNRLMVLTTPSKEAQQTLHPILKEHDKSA